MGAYLLGIDLGTSACKAALFDANGAVAGQASAAYPVYYPQPGWAEQNPDEWWAGVCTAVRNALERAAISPSEIAGVGIDGQSWSAIPVDAAGQALMNTPIWMDARAQEQCDRAVQELGGPRIFAVSGNPLTPSYTLPKILWYRDVCPDIYRRADKILQSNAFIAHRLTGVFSQDKSQGYGLACFNMRKGCWDEDLTRDFGIRRSLLPDICDCHHIVGRVTPEAAKLTGLMPGTPVAAGGLDAACGTLGAGVFQDGQTQEQGGQAGGMSICMERCVADERLILSMHVAPGRWLLQGGTVGGGGALKWLSEQVCAAEGMRAAENHTSIFEEMSEAAATVPAGSDGLIFLPYMAGERSPIWDIHAKGVYFGLDYAKTRAHMIRACMEGVAFSLRHNLEIAAGAGAPVGVMHAMGGAANSRVWTQIKADVTGCEIRVPASDTATPLGAAMLAGVGVGMYESFEQAVEKTVRISRTHAPNPENAGVYDRNYKKYRGLYEQLRMLMREE